MKVYREMNCYGVYDMLRASARAKADYLSFDEIDTVLDELERMYPDGISEQELNELFLYDDDLVARILGFSDFEEIMSERPNGAEFYMD